MDLVLFGVRSPLVVDYEETCRRLDIHVVAGVSVPGTARMLDPSRVIPLESLPTANLDAKFITCAFSSSRRKELCVNSRWRRDWLSRRL